MTAPGIKAITIWQPWASLIALGAKRIETRHWRTWHRGYIAIHAAKRWTREERDLCSAWPFADYIGGHVLERGPLPLGAVVAIARLDMCVSTDSLTLDERFPVHESAFGNYAPGRYGWVLDEVVALPTPVPCPGEQGLWTLDLDTLNEVRAQYRAAQRGEAVPA